MGINLCDERGDDEVGAGPGGGAPFVDVIINVAMSEEM